MRPRGGFPGGGPVSPFPLLYLSTGGCPRVVDRIWSRSLIIAKTARARDTGHVIMRGGGSRRGRRVTALSHVTPRKTRTGTDSTNDPQRGKVRKGRVIDKGNGPGRSSPPLTKRSGRGPSSPPAALVPVPRPARSGARDACLGYQARDIACNSCTVYIWIWSGIP